VRSANRLIASLALPLALAACGGDDQERLTKTQYEQRVRAEYAEVQRAFRATNVTGLALLADRIADAQDQLRDMADSLDDIEPPAEVATENRQVVGGLRTYADQLDELREAAEDEDAAAVRAIQERSGLLGASSVERIAEAAEAMKFKGYDLGPIAEE
jgi:hypothetical protein